MSVSEAKGPQMRKRADARRNEQIILESAAEAFLAAGVDAPIRDIAARTGLGMGTIYRHFPTRADLVIALFRHQVDACAAAGPELLASSHSPFSALIRWVDLFVDFLVTKHGLAEALQSDDTRFQTLHAYFLDRLVPVCAALLDAAAQAGESVTDVAAYTLLRGIGNLCAGANQDPHYDAHAVVRLLLAGLRQPHPVSSYTKPAAKTTAASRGLKERPHRIT